MRRIATYAEVAVSEDDVEVDELEDFESDFADVDSLPVDSPPLPDLDSLLLESSCS